MKIKNLTDYPQQLGDRKMIGAAGTADEEREYGLDKLTVYDQKLVKKNALEVIKEDAPTAPAAVEAEKPKAGGNSNAK